MGAPRRKSTGSTEAVNRGRVIQVCANYHIPMTTRSRRGRPPHDDLLTPAEWRVVHAVKHGMTSRQIAARRGISVEAVKFHVANALAKLGLTNRRALKAWHQAPKQSALHNRKESIMNAPTALGPIGQISRSVRDIKEAQTWYSDALGIPHLYTFGKLAFFNCGGTRLMLTEETGAAPESTLYLRVADIAAAHDDMRSRGVEFINAPHMIHRHADGTEEWMAFFKDPEGRTLAIMSQEAK
jgi:DNA-binding CsgD family transcriptional regulator/predicted enzyme related to lactoylglutathione lyase